MPRIIYTNQEGKRVPGTTTVIGKNLGWNKQALMWWANQMGLEGKNHRDEADKEATIGTIAHQMVECDLKGEKFDASRLRDIERAENAFLAWLEWKDLVDFNLLSSEESLVSENFQYGGTIDVAIVKTKTAILDLKTSNGIYPDHLIQLAAYGQLWNENYPLNPIEGYYLLRLGKENASFHYHFWHSLPEAWEAFLLLLQLHKLEPILKKA